MDRGATPASSSATGTTTTQSLSTSATTTTTTAAAAITDDTALDDSQYDDKPTKLLSREPPVHQYSGVLPKIAPKPNLTAVKTGNPGQVVIIQSPTGNPVPIRLAGSNNNAQSGKQGGAVTIQVLKMPDGRLVQIKNNKALNLTNLSNVTQFSVGGKKSTTPNTSNSTIIVKSSTAGTGGGISTQSKLQAGSNTIAGLMKSKANNELTAKQLHKLLPSTSPITAATGTSSFSASQILNAAKQNSQKISLPENKDIRIKSDETGMKQILVSQHLVKLSPNSAGPIQTIEIPGKPGLQYVRVLGTTSAGSSALSKGGTILTGIRPKDTMTPTTTTTTKMAVIPQVIGNQKIIMTSKPRQSLSFASFNKEGTSNILSQASSIKQNQKTLITTVPTLRKINDSTISKPAVPLAKNNNDDDPISFDSNNKAKISHLNQQIKKFNSSMSASITSNGQYPSAQNSKTQRLMVPLGIYRQMQANDAQSTKTSTTTATTDEFNAKKLYSVLKPSPDIMDEPLYPARKRSPSPDGLPRRKHCNCTKSQCLKLYCDCFANGEFCQDCNCKDCCNNLEFEDERQKAIKICLERNPNAFKPKITKARDQSDLRLHNKGCNCKRSGCLKNYCECYEAKIACSSNCKCFGCRNVEDRSEMDPLEVAKIAQNFGRGVSTKRPYDEISTDKIPPTNSAPQPPPSKQPYNFITQDVVDATIQCMIAQADECNKTGINSKNTERMILEELGRCLVEIIDFSIRNMEN